MRTNDSHHPQLKISRMVLKISTTKVIFQSRATNSVATKTLHRHETHLRYLHPPEVISISAEIEINTVPNRYHFRPKSHRQVNVRKF